MRIFTPLIHGATALALISLLLCIKATQSQPQEPWCRTRPQQLAASDQVAPTLIFTWTKDAAALSDPVAWLIRRLNYTENMQNNSNDYCGLFKSYYATEDEKTREQIDRKLRFLLLGSDRMAGYGVYFAENPTDSTDYDTYLVAVEVPPNVTAGAYINNINAVNVSQLVISDYDSIVYKWFTPPAMVLRGDSTLSSNPNRQIFAKSYDITPNTMRKEIWKLQPYEGPFEFGAILWHYRDFTRSTLYPDSQPLMQNETLTDYGKLFIIGGQWYYPFEQSNAACRGNASLCMNVAMSLFSNRMEHLDWLQMISLFVDAEYLNPADASSIAEGDFLTLKKFLIAKYDEYDVKKVGLDYLIQYQKMRQITPRLSTWKYY
jgi:hypothetical protein